MANSENTVHTVRGFQAASASKMFKRMPHTNFLTVPPTMLLVLSKPVH